MRDAIAHDSAVQHTIPVEKNGFALGGN